MRDRDNIELISLLNPDYMGFIFYPKSKRFVGANFRLEDLPLKNTGIQTVAVFVNETENTIAEIVSKYQFDVVQLHGNESADFCKNIKKLGVVVFKAFGIGNGFEWKCLKEYTNVCDYFLFDTNCAGYGGSGQKFNWDILNEYQYDTPFILSGGIGESDVLSIQKLSHSKFVGIDINSQFEVEPALKDVVKVGTFLKNIAFRKYE